MPERKLDGGKKKKLNFEECVAHLLQKAAPDKMCTAKYLMDKIIKNPFPCEDSEGKFMGTIPSARQAKIMIDSKGHVLRAIDIIQGMCKNGNRHNEIEKSILDVMKIYNKITDLFSQEEGGRSVLLIALYLFTAWFTHSVLLDADETGKWHISDLLEYEQDFDMQVGWLNEIVNAIKGADTKYLNGE